MGLLDRALNIGESKQFRQYEKRVARIADFEPELELESDEELRARMDALRERVRGVPDKDQAAALDDALPESFAIVREVGKRKMGMRHFDVQLIGGMVLHGGQIAEMKTGEGKTLTATLAVVLNSLAGKGVHVVTVNDYLAQRDAEWMAPIYEACGVSVGDPAEHAALRGQARRLRRRRHVRHELRVRLRLPARQHGRSRWRRRSSTAGASARTAARRPPTSSRSSTRSTTSSSTRPARR